MDATTGIRNAQGRKPASRDPRSKCATTA